MGYIASPIKNWGQSPSGFVATRVCEPAGHIGSHVTLLSGVTLYNNRRPVFATGEEAVSSTNLKRGDYEQVAA
jgi:hypothetical protein